MHLENAEEVMVVPTVEFLRAGDFTGWNRDIEPYRKAFLMHSPRFMPRHKVEDDVNLKQIIPYVVVTAVMPKTGDLYYLAYRRGVKEGENRLHKKLSIGWGGHINPCDQLHVSSTAWACTVVAAKREIREEIGKPEGSYGDYLPTAVGMVNNDCDPVGRVHLGVVMRLRLPTPSAYPIEGKVDGWAWMRSGELLERADEFETWSKLIIREGLYQI